MKVKKILIATMLVLTALLCLSACDQSDKTTENGKVSLRFSWWGSGVRHEATLAVIKKYMTLHPNVEITAEYGGNNGYYQKLLTQLAGGTEPDIIQIDIPWLDSIVQSNHLIDLKGSKDFDFSGFSQNTLVSAGNPKDHVYALPTGINGFVFVYDKSLEKDLNVKIKDGMTWDEIMAIGQKSYDYYHGKKSFILQDIDTVTLTTFIRSYMQMTGTNAISDDGKRNITEEQATKILQLIDDLYKKHVFTPYAQILPYEGNYFESPSVANHQILGSIIYVSQIQILTNSAKDIDWGIVTLPNLPNATVSAMHVGASQLMVISNKSKYPEEATKFLNYFFNDPDAIKTLGTVRAVPASTNGVKVLSDNHMITPLIAQASSTLVANGARYQNKMDVAPEFRSIFVDVIQSVALGKATPADAAKQLISRIDGELARK